MFIVIWEYRVKADRLEEFEILYSPTGAWARLFQKSNGFLETQLLRDEIRPDRYLTLDKWLSSQEFESFLVRWKKQYTDLDQQCENLTESETLIGRWETIPS